MISGVILVLDLVFVWINFYSAKKALIESQTRDGESIKNAFSLSLDLHALDLQQVAALLAADKTVQDLFLLGKKSVQEEGGGPGGPRTAVIRKKMYDTLKDRWTLL